MQVAKRACVHAEHHVHVAVGSITRGVHRQRGGASDGVERSAYDVGVGTQGDGHGEHDEHAAGDSRVGEVAAYAAEEHLDHGDGRHGAFAGK